MQIQLTDLQIATILSAVAAPIAALWYYIVNMQKSHAEERADCQKVIANLTIELSNISREIARFSETTQKLVPAVERMMAELGNLQQGYKLSDQLKHLDLLINQAKAGQQ